MLQNKHYMKAPNALNSDGRTALHFACAVKNDAFVDFLTAEGVTLEKYVKKVIKLFTKSFPICTLMKIEELAISVDWR